MKSFKTTIIALTCGFVLGSSMSVANAGINVNRIQGVGVCASLDVKI